MHIHRALFDIDIGAPHLIKKLSTAVGTLLVGHEEFEKFELCRPHIERHVIGKNAVTGGIEAQAIHIDTLFLVGRAHPAQYRLDAGQQFARGKRLGDVIVSANVQPLHAVVFIVFGGEHDNQHIASQFLTPQAPQQLDTAGDRHHPVEQHQVWSLINNNAVSFLGIGCLQAIVARKFQAYANHFANGCLVIDDEDGLGCRHACPFNAA